MKLNSLAALRLASFGLYLASLFLVVFAQTGFPRHIPSAVKEPLYGLEVFFMGFFSFALMGNLGGVVAFLAWTSNLVFLAYTVGTLTKQVKPTVSWPAYCAVTSCAALLLSVVPMRDPSTGNFFVLNLKPGAFLWMGANVLLLVWALRSRPPAGAPAA